MALTAAKCIDHIEHSLGGSIDSLLTVYEIINQAGELLVDMHPWQFLGRLPVSLSLIAGQPYITLPADLIEIVDLETIYEANASVQMSSLAEINWMRSISTTTTFQYFVALNIVEDTASGTDGQPVKRLEIWPTPATGDGTGNEFNLIYRGTWAVLDTTDDLVRIPNHLNSLFIEILRAVARGYEEEDNGTLSERLLAVVNGPILRMAREREDRMQPENGDWNGGAAEGFYSNDYRPVRNGNLANPS